MSNASRTTASQIQPRSAAVPRRTGSGGLFQNILFALAVGFAAAIVLGLVP